MPFEGRQRAAVIDRCWSIYLSITRTLSVPEHFHIEFPVMVESAIISGTLQFTVGVGGDLRFILREEYVFDRQRLTMARYSYNLMDASDHNLLRADNLPFHRTDYRRRLLAHPPHHLHDQRDRIHSFNGDVHNFIARAKVLIASTE